MNPSLERGLVGFEVSDVKGAQRSRAQPHYGPGLESQDMWRETRCILIHF